MQAASIDSFQLLGCGIFMCKCIIVCLICFMSKIGNNGMKICSTTLGGFMSFLLAIT